MNEDTKKLLAHYRAQKVKAEILNDACNSTAEVLPWLVHAANAANYASVSLHIKLLQRNVWTGTEPEEVNDGGLHRANQLLEAKKTIADIWSSARRMYPSAAPGAYLILFLIWVIEYDKVQKAREHRDYVYNTLHEGGN